jgi:hypothetical protein
VPALLVALPAVPAAAFVPAASGREPEAPALLLTAAPLAPAAGDAFVPAASVPVPAVAIGALAGAVPSPQPDVIIAIARIATPRTCAVFIASSVVIESAGVHRRHSFNHKTIDSAYTGTQNVVSQCEASF